MSGVLGGLLYLANKVGGIALHTLIGSKAWSKNAPGHWFRLIFGGYSLGLFVGIIIYVINRPNTTLAFVLVGIPTLSIFVILLLEFISIVIEDKKDLLS